MAVSSGTTWYCAMSRCSTAPTEGDSIEYAITGNTVGSIRRTW